jgi:hypothetical protein
MILCGAVAEMQEATNQISAYPGYITISFAINNKTQCKKWSAETCCYLVCQR